MIDKKEILDFIKRRWLSDCKWNNGNCWWFAKILTIRFPDLEIYYLPVTGHFVSGDGSIFFDHKGVVETDEKIIKFDDIKNIDSNWYKYLIRDCIM